MKPVASGCELTEAGLRNDDALRLIAESNVKMAYDLVNPFAYEPAIAPHIAAQEVGRPVDIGKISGIAKTIEADYLVVEGVGGWCVPLGETSMLAELARATADEVIIVVGMRLGCINHALLTAAQVRRDGMLLKGWIANHVDPEMHVQSENLETLQSLMPCPMLGVLPFKGSGRNSPELKVHSKNVF